MSADEVPGLSFESHVWYLMCVSSEHLNFALEAMRATKTMYPTAYMTVARTAFLAAVNAVWLLAAQSRQERRERIVKLRADELRVQATSFDTMTVPEGEPERALSDLVGQIRSKQLALQSIATELGISEPVAKMRLNQTRVIDWVATYMHGEGSELLVGGNQSIWRSGSAASHAQMHFGLMRQEQNEILSDGAGATVLKFRGNLEMDVGPAMVGALLALNEAFRLYDLRRTKHL